MNQSFMCKGITTFMNLPLDIQRKKTKPTFVKSVKSYIINQYWLIGIVNGTIEIHSLYEVDIKGTTWNHYNTIWHYTLIYTI